MWDFCWSFSSSAAWRLFSSRCFTQRPSHGLLYRGQPLPADGPRAGGAGWSSHRKCSRWVICFLWVIIQYSRLTFTWDRTSQRQNSGNVLALFLALQCMVKLKHSYSNPMKFWCMWALKINIFSTSQLILSKNWPLR